MKKSSILLIIGLLIIFFVSASCTKKNYDEFAKCLAQNGVTMYGAFWCPHCANQKEMFGSSFQYVTYVECSNPDKTQNDLCKSEGIKSYPTWQFKNDKNNRVPGELSFLQLSQLSGCSITNT